MNEQHTELQSTDERRPGFLAGMRIRKKLMFLHTLFSLLLTLVLLVAIRPSVLEVVRQAELDEAALLLDIYLDTPPTTDPPASGSSKPYEHGRLGFGSADQLALTERTVIDAKAAPRTPVITGRRSDDTRAIAYLPEQDRYVSAAVEIPEARAAVRRLYLLLILSVLAVYALVALALEVFVLPQHVYAPIRRMLKADRAVQAGRKDEELIPQAEIPADELGEIMTSRNRSIVALRNHETALAAALGNLEEVANDLKRKNHLLETARQNLAESDRLASLGMMSAGIAHELNTPLAVLKGLVEKLNADASSLSESEAALMLRVVGRLERLSEGLLDFARARPPIRSTADLRTLVEDATTLVSLDRGARNVRIENQVDESVRVVCDPDRLVQVFVNLIRNAVDALRGAPERADHTVEIDAEPSVRDGREWVTITVADNGPGIPPEKLSTIFEPFVSTRLDARGTGLGLAVAEGIVREHAGVILARNRPGTRGAMFEIMLPSDPEPAQDRAEQSEPSVNG